MSDAIKGTGAAAVSRLDHASGEREAIVKDMRQWLNTLQDPKRYAALKGLVPNGTWVDIPTVKFDWGGKPLQFTKAGIDQSVSGGYVNLHFFNSDVVAVVTPEWISDKNGAARNTPKDLEAAFVAIINHLNSIIPDEPRAGHAV